MRFLTLTRQSQSTEARFEQLVRPHVAELYKFAYKLTLCEHDAEDLVQDVLTKLYPQTDRIAEIEELRPWLQQTLYHQFIDHCRKQQRNPVGPKLAEEFDEATSPEPENSGLPEPEQARQADEQSAEIFDALNTLQPEQRALIVMHIWEGFTLESLAREFGVPLGTLKSRLHRTKAQLKKSLCMEPFPPVERYINRGVQDEL